MDFTSLQEWVNPQPIYSETRNKINQVDWVFYIEKDCIFGKYPFYYWACNKGKVQVILNLTG
jgi:hypothetical protein